MATYRANRRNNKAGAEKLKKKGRESSRKLRYKKKATVRILTLQDVRDMSEIDGMATDLLRYLHEEGEGLRIQLVMIKTKQAGALNRWNCRRGDDPETLKSIFHLQQEEESLWRRLVVIQANQSSLGRLGTHSPSCHQPEASACLELSAPGDSLSPESVAECDGGLGAELVDQL